MSHAKKTGRKVVNSNLVSTGSEYTQAAAVRLTDLNGGVMLFAFLIS